MDQLEPIIRSRANVISTCEELAFPFPLQPELARRLDDVARAFGVSILGTGVNPGFVMDALPVMLTMVCEEIEDVYVLRAVDTATRRVQLQTKTGAGISPEEFRQRVANGQLGHVGLKESLLLLAHGLGWSLDDVNETIEPVVADRERRSADYTVRAGQAVGLRQRAVGRLADRDRIVLELLMELEAEDPRDEVRINGTPPVHVLVPNGVSGDIATIAVVANCARRIIAAPPGLLTMLDLPLGTSGSR